MRNRFLNFKKQVSKVSIETSTEWKKEKEGKMKVFNLVILDKSGSMSCIAEAAISGFNETVASIRVAQKEYADSQEHYVSLMVFCDCEKYLLYDKVPVAEVKPLTANDYQPCCSTPLYDAMGFSLTALRNDIAGLSSATAAVTIITDGMENASREYSLVAIKALVDELSEKEGWQFSYIGTNQDVHKVSADLSIRASMSFDYNADGMKKAWTKERMAKRRMYARLNLDKEQYENMSFEDRKAFIARKNKINSFYVTPEMVQDRVTPAQVTSLKDNEIFVFGSHAEGSHQGGAAAYAVQKFGAIVGQAEGLQGKSYAIPTTGVSKEDMEQAVYRFMEFARQHPELKFFVTKIGCGHGGYVESEVASMFVYAPDIDNISLPAEFWELFL